jgi:CheY-like chemotaxis protein
LRETTVIALTGYGGEEDRQRSAAVGIHLHLVKPVNPHELRRLLSELSGVPTFGSRPPTEQALTGMADKTASRSG